MARILLVGVAALLGALPCAAQGTESEQDKVQRLENKVEELSRKLEQLELRDEGVGAPGEAAPRHKSDAWLRMQEEGEVGKPAGDTLLSEKIRIGGRFEFEYYDSVAERRDLGSYGPLQFGMRDGASEFRVRRFELMVGMDLIQDVSFESRLVLDPVLEDQLDEVNLEEAYFRFANIVQHIFDVEDPTHTTFRFGNYLRWEREFLPRNFSTWSMSATSFYRYRVTGLELSGKTEDGLFYSLSVDDGYQLIPHDAGIDPVGASPMFADFEQDGASQNHKDVAVGVGVKSRSDDPMINYRAGISYRYGKLSTAERNFLASVLPTYDGGSKKSRLGLLAGIDWDMESVVLKFDGELWYAEDGNAKRDVSGLSAVCEVPLEGMYFQNRPFFNSFSFGYRIGYLHQSGSIPNAAVTTDALFDDRVMHTGMLGLEVTRDVDLFLEINQWNENRVDVHNTEWTLLLAIDF
ncbi:MAG: hypothetical protein R3F30_00440 [Planctomycetota bacterium]